MLKTVRDVCQFIGSIVVDGPVCVETGSTYCIEPTNLIHTTTNNIANYICLPNNGILYSFDIDADHQKAAESICDVDSSTIFICGDSVQELAIEVSGWDRTTGEIDVLWLDSKEFDVEHAVKEFEVVKHLLADKHFVLVDDIHNANSVKWFKIVPLLKELGYDYTEIPTPTGLFLSAKGYPVKE